MKLFITKNWKATIVKLDTMAFFIEMVNILTICSNSIAISASLEQSFHHFLLSREIHFLKKFSEANLPFIPPNIIISWVGSVSINTCNCWKLDQNILIGFKKIIEWCKNINFFVNMLNDLLFLQYKLNHRHSTRLYIGLWKYWNFQREAEVEQIIAIATTPSVSCSYKNNTLKISHY